MSRRTSATRLTWSSATDQWQRAVARGKLSEEHAAAAIGRVEVAGRIDVVAPGPDVIGPTRGSLPLMSEQVDSDVLMAMAGNPDTLARRMGIVLTEASAERVVGTMPVEGNVQPFGLLHGGASCVLAETLGSVAASLHAGRLFGGYAVGVDISATHHRAAREGLVTGVATPLHLGGLVATYEIAITDADGQRVCSARLTCILRKP